MRFFLDQIDQAKPKPRLVLTGRRFWTGAARDGIRRATIADLNNELVLVWSIGPRAYELKWAQ